MRSAFGAGRLVLPALLLAAALLLPAAAQAKILGIIYPETCVFYDAATDALKGYLSQNGYGEGKLEVYVQKPAADPMSWTNALRKFAAVDADMIVIWGDNLLQTACKEKIRTPMGYGFVLEPSLSSCARSPSNPGGNAAGVTSKTPLQTLLAKARLLAPFKTLGVLDPAGDRLTTSLIKELRGLEGQLGFTVAAIPVAAGTSAAEALRGAAGIDLFLLPTCSLVTGETEALLAVAAERTLPTVSLQPPRGKAAALLALYPSPEEQGRIVGELAVQMLEKGLETAPPAPLAPKRIELEINLPLARQLGLKIPMALLDSATRIIK